MEPRILLEDRDFFLCIKPVGVLSESPGMPELLAERNGGKEVFPVHRLDRDVGGAMVYARSKKAAGALSATVAERRMEKEYLAVVSGTPEEAEGVYRDLLYKDAQKNKSFVVKRPRRGVKEAELSYKVLALKNGLSLVRIRLMTGRSHQIRVQFASRGMPLVGDRKYGSRQETPIALWSYRLAFPHPSTGQLTEAKENPPKLWPWTEFNP